ncbi:MAG: FAD-dependent oxidoreductase [Planctomycetia bacterium]|nr:FAD-dependent oxidoreductase [Planctomycetia bacterium]
MDRLTRRRFFQAGLGSTAALVCNSDSISASAQKGKTFMEPAQEVPIRGQSDIIVCGGGPAGAVAAISAARAGAKVQLLELQGSLGGVWTSGLLTYIFDFDKCKIAMEIIDRLDKVHARRCKSKRNFVYEPEYMKWILEQMCLEAGVQFRLHTNVASVHRTGRVIDTIITESKSGREAWCAPIIIDATGDGDVAARAGCGFDMGSESDGKEQPLTLNGFAIVRDYTKLTGFISNIPEMWKPGGHGDSFRKLLAEIHKTGMEPSYFNPTLFQVHENLLTIMINHEYNVKADDAQAVSDASVRARAEIIQIIDGLNKLGGPWEGMRSVHSAEQIGIRSGRRVHGLYKITKEDVAAGRRFEDGVTLSRFGIDIHAHDFKTNKKETIGRGGIKYRPFEVPLRSMIAKDVDNLILAGRCISGDFISHASYRVTGSATAMGETAGIVAAKAVHDKCLPKEVEWKKQKSGD